MGFAGDMELLKEVRENYDGPLRVDVNAGWTVEQLIQNIDGLVEAEVEMIEQPLKPGEDDQLKKIDIPLNIFADESVQGIDSFDEMSERSEEHTSELQSRGHLVCRLLLEKKKRKK